MSQIEPWFFCPSAFHLLCGAIQKVISIVMNIRTIETGKLRKAVRHIYFIIHINNGGVFDESM